MRSYQRELDALLKGMEEQEGAAKSLLLHACCAPCSSYVLEYLSRYFKITVFYYNPNISPEAEYKRRVAEIRRFIREFSERGGSAGKAREDAPDGAGEGALHMYPIGFIEGEYDHSQLTEMARGLENVPEGGERCFKCYEQRLRESARLAAEGGYDYFCTTLSISPHKNAAKLMEIGERIGREYGVDYLPSDFKKRDGFKRSVELSAEYSLYRQSFCGCEFSKSALHSGS